MIIYIQIILIVVLLLILAALYIEERQKKAINIPRGRLTHFWDGRERRRFVRVSANIPVIYSLPKGSSNLIVRGTKDISIGGICITITEKLSPRSNISLAIEITGGAEPIIASGEVAWTKENTEIDDKEGIRYFDTGIEFKGIIPKDKERLFALIREHENKQRGQD
ncbi:MAG: PilZ domain-containing protein [Candidatus Omnitrophica bacterium]|nr:PilZ domain-containing protein [Candidatus Omnitrophota bacterium]